MELPRNTKFRSPTAGCYLIKNAGTPRRLVLFGIDIF